MAEQIPAAPPLSDTPGAPPPLPVRMLNEFVYCPRLAYLEWVQGEWADSADTVQGRAVHRRVDRPGGRLPPAAEASNDPVTLHARSVTLASEALGLICKMDLIEGEGAQVVPVDYKRGKRPHVAQGAYDPERVQLCAQGLILEAHGYTSDHGVLYYAGSKERVPVAFDADLRALTHTAIAGLRQAAASGRIPPPLEDSPKCPRCSLVGICLPDEVNHLQGLGSSPRPLSVQLDRGQPLYVQANGAKVARDGETLVVSVKDEDQEDRRVRLGELSQVVLIGNVYLTTPALQELLRREIPVSWHGYSGWFYGHTQGLGHRNVEVRTAQYRTSFEPDACLALARGLVRAKILNSRTLLRRNWPKDPAAPAAPLAELRRYAKQAARAQDLGELLGIEGAAAAAYFGRFDHLLHAPSAAADLAFDFTGRNRRPPTDPVNALLSFAYSVLTRSWHVTLTAVGFDPYRGFLHQPRYGRPALALDLMEPFRPLVADSAVLTAINNGEVGPEDFVWAAGAVSLTPTGRRRFLGTLERRLGQEVTHPLFGYRLSYRRLFELQSRLLARTLLGELPSYPNFLTR